MTKGGVPSGATGVLDSCRSSYCTVISELFAHESHRLRRDPPRGFQEMSIYKVISVRLARALCFAVLLVVVLPSGVFVTPASAQLAVATSSATSLELSRTVRPWEFLSATGTAAGLFGNEGGTIEAWVYPLKILREFHLRFHTDRRVINAETLARTIMARPESVTILYTGDTYNVRETFFVPVDEQGAIIRLEIETEHPLEIEALFQRDFQLEWPAGLGGTYGYWDEPRNAFYIGEETKKFVALVGSPTAHDEQVEYLSDYSNSDQNGFRLGVTEKGKETKLIVMAASVNGPAEADKTYHHLLADADVLLQSSAKYYRDYLARTVSLELPDKQLQQAYDWSRISELQGVVKNPYLGTGIVAGYRTSGSGQRPGFAWFFGRDSMWTSLAYDASGDFASARTALDFLSKVQRADGKIPHEIAQGAGLVPWFESYPYAWAAADATPLYIITMNDYAVESGDVAFAKEKWGSLQKAYDFLRSTYDEQGLPKNFGIGHGWVEGGPLLPVKTELYQSALGIEALRALGNLAALTGNDAQSKELQGLFAKQQMFLNDVFWVPETKRFAFALDQEDKRVDQPTVLSTVPMWFGLLDEQKANLTIDELAKPSHQSDWGMRIIGNDAAKYSAGGYHFGAVWPLFTGWASVGEYRYHRAAPAYSNLRANALLALDGAMGHTTEVLSGDYYSSLSTSSPHQIWSAAMVVDPLLRGMLGTHREAATRTVTLAPHFPATWTSFSAHGMRAGDCVLDVEYTKTSDAIRLSVTADGVQKEVPAGPRCALDFAPAVSLRAKISTATLDGQRLPMHIETTPYDQHAAVHVVLDPGKQHNVVIHMRNDFGVTYDSRLPRLGTASRALHIVSEDWSAARDQLVVKVTGLAGQDYRLDVSDASQISGVDGGKLVKSNALPRQLRLRMPDGNAGTFVNSAMTIHLVSNRPAKNSAQ
jgi:glycogen debranching enzyme